MTKQFREAALLQGETVEIIVAVRPNPRVSVDDFLGGIVLRRSATHATVRITFRCSPTGPWFTQVHRVPLETILSTINRRIP